MAEARAKNPDTVAWLYIPGAEVDDPVMQAEDNGYYLKLDENGEYAMWGCYYAHCENQIGGRDELDKNTTIFGHSASNCDPDGPKFTKLYSKKFLAEHESEITIHKAAKNYFDGLGLKKLPTIKSLNTEYAELLAEKKAAYADYRKAREEMKELLTAKANIDRILELDKELEEANERREKEAEQR